MSRFSKTELETGLQSVAHELFPDIYNQSQGKFIDLLTLTQLKKYIAQLNKIVKAELVIKTTGKTHSQLKDEITKKWFFGNYRMEAKKLYVDKSKVEPKLTKAQQKIADKNPIPRDYTANYGSLSGGIRKKQAIRELGL